MKKILFTFLSAFILVLSCGEEKKNDLFSEEETASGPVKVDTIMFAEECEKFKKVNDERCFIELLAKFKGDSILARKYCECISEEMLKRYTCKEIMALKDSMKNMHEEEQRIIMEPITNACKEKVMKK